MIKKIASILASVFLLIISFTTSAEAAVLPSGFSETEVARDILSPTSMTFAPDGRLFVSQQNGQLRVIKNGQLLSTPFVTVEADTYNERGLSGVAFDPDFATNGYIYLYYTASSPVIHNRLSRFTASGDTAVPGSEFVMIDLPAAGDAGMHNSGALHFGPDGKLYVTIGDNGTSSNAQSLNNLFGKIIRINKDGTIPNDNPFFSTTTGVNRAIWALGLRNPFKFSFQPGTWRMFINDVGQATYEEINEGVSGANYGWPTTEGPIGSFTQFRGPLYYYTHQVTSGPFADCAITGGAFYNPSVQQFPNSFNGKYFFMDYCGRWMRTFNPATGTVENFADVIWAPVDVKVGPDGLVYYLDRGENGRIRKIRYTASQAPSISQHPENKTVTVGQSVTFTVSANGTAPLTYEWQRDGETISGATAQSYTLNSVSEGDDGAAFQAVVTNSFGSVTSNPGVLTVSTNASPTGSITAPASTLTYNAGDTINYSGSGVDPEDGTLPASAFTWKVDFHHDNHFHPFIPETTGAKTGSFVTARSGETSPNTWYRIHLTVRDSQGFTHSSFRDIRPNTVQLTLQTSPTGLQVKLEGQPVTTPYSFSSVVNMPRTIEAVSPQTVGGTAYTFSSWSDGGTMSHNFDAPNVNTTYTANFTPSSTSCDARTGLGCVKATLGSSVSWTNPIQSPLTLQENTNYTASVWLKGNSSLKLVTQPCWNCGSQAKITVCKAISSWTQCSHTFTTGTTNLNNYILMIQDGVNSPVRPAGVVFIDDVFLGVSTEGTTNVLNNPGFENGLTNWTNSNNVFTALTCTTAASPTPTATPTPTPSATPVVTPSPSATQAPTPTSTPVVTPTPTPTPTSTPLPSTEGFYRAIDFGGSASMFIDGNFWENSAAPNYNFVGGYYTANNVTLVPSTDANRTSMIRSFIYKFGGSNVTLTSVPNANYDVYLYVWEDNTPATYTIYLEGKVVQPNYNSGPAGTWKKLGPWSVNITDGAINITSSGSVANFSGIEVWRR